MDSCLAPPAALGTDAWSTEKFYVLGTLLSMQVPFIGLQPLHTAEHMLAFCVFLACQLVAAAQYVKSRLSRGEDYRLVARTVLLTTTAVATLLLAGLSTLGYIRPLSTRLGRKR